MDRYQKTKGKEGEAIALQHYLQSGYLLASRNYTIPGGELDLVMYTPNELIFVEVKVIDHMQDISEYLTPRKLSTLRRTIDAYLHDYPSEKQISLDVLFVQDDRVAEWYRNVTNN